MGWLYLAAAIILEVSGTTCMKLANGFENKTAASGMFVLYALAFTSLTMALKTMDVSIAYAVWAGVGTALIAGIGFLFFQEPLTPIKIVSLILIIVGVFGVHFGS